MKNKINSFLCRYWQDIFKKLNEIELSKFKYLRKKITSLNKKNKIIIIGNGGSASISSHMATDFTKITGHRAICFNEANLITCFANDYGYENWVQKALKFYAIPGDIIILISSSGKSKNLINACLFAKKKKYFVATLTGFQKNNPLSKLGNINFWVNSKKYNIVEMVHHTWLVALADSLIKNYD
jgi:D-sedoheptulose 7-phosphate isomerase